MGSLGSNKKHVIFYHFKPVYLTFLVVSTALRTVEMPQNIR